MGIPFDSLGVKLSTTELPTDEFYSVFYQHLFRCYQDFSDLPLGWREDKLRTAKQLERSIPLNSRVLAFGSGLGYVERELALLRPDIQITAYDHATSTRYLSKSQPTNVSIVHSTCDFAIYDSIYLCQVLYGFPYQSAIELLGLLATHLSDGGKMILINTSVNICENKPKELMCSLASRIIMIWKLVMKFFSQNQRGQLWGFERDNRRYVQISRDAGLKLEDVSASASQSFIVLSQ